MAKKKAEKVELSELELLRQKINAQMEYEAIEFATADRYKRGKLPTGIIPMDIMLRGGIKIGATHELFGPPQVGKTWFAYNVLGKFQKYFQKPVGFIDLEHTFDGDFAETAELNTSSDWLLIGQVQSGGDAIDVLEMMVRSNGVCAVCMDSIAALATKAELEKRGDQDTMGGQSKLMSAALRKVTTVNDNGVTIIFLNQVREKIGSFMGGYTSPGGMAIKHYATTRMEFRQGRRIVAKGKSWDDGKGVFKEEDVTVGHAVKVNLAKAKCGARPFDTCSWKFWYPGAPGREIGYSEVDELMVVGLRYGLLQKSGSWYSWKDGSLKSVQGDNQLWQQIRDTPEALDALRSLASDVLLNTFSETEEDCPETEEQSEDGNEAPAEEEQE